MDLGLSIFLSTVLICSIWLYYLTRDRWNWKKILIRIGIIIGIIGIILLSFFIYDEYFKEKPFQSANISEEKSREAQLEEFKPEKLTILEDFVLEDSQSNIKFKHGKPEWASNKPEVWSMNRTFGVCLLYFVDKKVVSIITNRYHDPYFNKPEEIIMKWGEPQIKIDYDDDLRKLFLYSNYNLFFIFMRNNAIYQGVYLPQYEEEVKELILSKRFF